MKTLVTDLGGVLYSFDRSLNRLMHEAAIVEAFAELEMKDPRFEGLQAAREEDVVELVTAAEQEAVSIRQQASQMADQEKQQTIQKAVEDAGRMGELRRGTLELQRQKAIEAISQRVVSVTLQRLQERFANRLDGRAHGSVNNFHTVLFTTKK